MNCGISDTEWTDYLDQALSFRERRKIEAHLRHCAACRSELHALRQIDQRLRIECGLIRQSMNPPAARDRILAILQQSGSPATNDRLRKVRWVLALLCGSNTATRIIAAAESHSKPDEQNWLLFLRRLSFLTTEICGSYAGELIWAVGQ
jgi:anti-sigma factor RsiW